MKSFYPYPARDHKLTSHRNVFVLFFIVCLAVFSISLNLIVSKVGYILFSSLQHLWLPASHSFTLFYKSPRHLVVQVCTKEELLM
jgi:hypothetical protein